MTTKERRAWYNDPFKEDNTRSMSNQTLKSCQLCQDSTGCTGACHFNGEQDVLYTPPGQTPQLGWICPRCGSGMSPYTDKCGCAYNPSRFQVT